MNYGACTSFHKLRLSAVRNHELTSIKDLPDGDEPKRVHPQWLGWARVTVTGNRLEV